MQRFTDKVVLITGGAAGIGEAVAARLLAEGAQVMLVDADRGRVETTAARLGGHVGSIAADVSDPAATRHYVERTIDRHGRIDAAFLNAGIEGRYGKISDVGVEMFDDVMAVNVRGVWLGLAEIMPHMAGRGGGSILITSSIGGLRGTAGWAAYGTSKHALVGLAKSAALEGAKAGVRVNAVNPAPIETRMIGAIDEQMNAAGLSGTAAARAGRIPLGRYGRVEEASALCAFLLSNEASFCTGGCYLVDGGVMAN